MTQEHMLYSNCKKMPAFFQPVVSAGRSTAVAGSVYESQSVANKYLEQLRLQLKLSEHAVTDACMLHFPTLDVTVSCDAKACQSRGRNSSVHTTLVIAAVSRLRLTRAKATGMERTRSRDQRALHIHRVSLRNAL
jgi:hypothetical protein